MIIEFHLNNKCNLRCTYCYQHYKSNDSMSLDTGKQIIDTLFPSIDSNIYHDYFGDKKTLEHDFPLEFSFFGGEALLDIDLIDGIMSYFEERNQGKIADYTISIATNGVLLSTKKVRAFTEKWSAHVRYDITLDGDKTLHDSCRKFADGSGSFDIVYDNFIKYKEYFGEEIAPLKAKMTLSPENIQYFADGYKFLDGIGMSITFNFACGKQSEWTDEKVAIAKEQLDIVVKYLLAKYNGTNTNIAIFDTMPLSPSPLISSCGTAGERISIDWNGDIFTCQMFSSTSIHDGKYPPIGNVFEGISESRMREHRYDIQHRSGDAYPSFCEGCRAKARLCEQCPAESYEMFGDVSAIDTSRCKPTKALLAAIDKYRAEKKN